MSDHDTNVTVTLTIAQAKALQSAGEGGLLNLDDPRAAYAALARLEASIKAVVSMSEAEKDTRECPLCATELTAVRLRGGRRSWWWCWKCERYWKAGVKP